jgi:hypothetical protein
MRELFLAGCILVAFGVGGSFAAQERSAFTVVNVALGAAALLASALVALRRARGAGAPAFRRPLVAGVARVAAALLIGVLAERGAAKLGWQADWSFETRFAPAPATLSGIRALCERGRLDASLYREDFDPRVRSTRLLLQTLGRATGCLPFDERRLEDHPEDEDRYGIAGSNSVVLRLRTANGERYELVDRPSEATLFEAIFRLRDLDSGTLYVATGAGEGDVEEEGPNGYSGLAAALRTEGYRLQLLVSAAAPEIPADARALIWIAPERDLLPAAVDALERYLARGGRLVAFTEPGRDTGLERTLARFGIAPEPGVVIDPASAPAPPETTSGVDLLVYSYASSHPVATGLAANRMTYLRGACAFQLRKPEIEDRIDGVAYTSPRAWLTRDGSVLSRRVALAPPAGTSGDFLPVVAAGRYPRGGAETRIVAFCDAGLASNHSLRALYNYDLVVNAVHWAAEREPLIDERPKLTGSLARLQFPLPVQNTLRMFQGLGLLLPELLLLAAAILWVRTRSA